MAGSLTYFAVRLDKGIHNCLRVPACYFHYNRQHDRPPLATPPSSRTARGGGGSGSATRGATSNPSHHHHHHHPPDQIRRWSQWSRTQKLLRVRTEEEAGTGTAGDRFIHQTQPAHYQAKLTPAEVTTILRANEYSNTDLAEGPVKSYDMNTLQSNNPIEDAHAEAVLTYGTNGLLFGIFDGHGGAACGQVVAKRILHYLAAGLLTPAELAQHIEAVASGDRSRPEFTLLQNFNDHFELVHDLKELYQKSYEEYLRDLHEKYSSLNPDSYSVNMEDVLVNSFNRMDDDMSREAIPKVGGLVNMKTLTVAMSGCVAVVAHVDGPHLHIASTGDCTAVIGSLSETDTWLAKKLTTEHNSDNQKEVKRILSEHPESEQHHIIKGDRLLSILAPLRAFGDFKFKWDRDTIQGTLGAILGEHACPPNYKTPPYLTATPEVTYHHLSPRDKFMVIGSDGLWDMMTPMQVIRLVGEHMSGKVTLSPLQLANPHIPLGDISAILKQRQNAMKLKPVDSNAATHLIRCALGGTAYGVDHGRLSQMLSLPADMVRMFRDDITITVVFFNDEYLRHV